nr:MerC domain-containing protein [Daejeonella sp. JGW-45]
MKLTHSIDKLGTTGLFLTAILSPCCFPIFAFGASLFGFGSAELFGGWTMWIFQAMIIVSIAGLIVSYFQHKYLYPLLIAIPSAALIFYGYHFDLSDYYQYMIYIGMVGMLAATWVNYKKNKGNNHRGNADDPTSAVELTSTITCPDCGFKKTETMATDSCQYFYKCTNCEAVLKPQKGDCCVFCSYGTVKCPPIQQNTSCC